MRRYRVWGIAAGYRSTSDAAPGAFTWREYDGEIPEQDWRQIIKIEEL